MRAFQYKLEDDIKKLQNLQEIYSNKQGWIVESMNHVNIGEGKGLNKTAFAVKSPLSCGCAQVWNTLEDAKKYGADYYLVDGKGESLQMIFTKAYDFFTREIDNVKELLLFTQSQS